MTNQEILDNAPEGATHIDRDGLYLRYDLNKVLELYHVNYKHWQQASTWIGVYRSLADIKRIAELENLINSQVFPSIGDGFSCEYINGYEKALSDLDKALKEQGE